MFIAFYKSNTSTVATIRASAPNDRGGKKYRLTANTSKAAQEALENCSEGDNVDYEFDYEQGKFLASANGEYIGAFPVAANDLLEKGRPAHIDSLESNDADKIIAYVVINMD